LPVMPSFARFVVRYWQPCPGKIKVTPSTQPPQEYNMKDATFSSFIQILEEMASAFGKVVRYGLSAIGEMSWQAILLGCLVLAMAMTVIPLALFLFLVFMAVKLAVAAVVVKNHRGPATPYTEAEAKPEADQDSK
jgi:hypothetical protein